MADSPNQWGFFESQFSGPPLSIPLYPWDEGHGPRSSFSPLCALVKPSAPRAFIFPDVEYLPSDCNAFPFPSQMLLCLDPLQCPSPKEALTGSLFPAPLQKALIPRCPGHRFLVCVLLHLQAPGRHALLVICLFIPMVSTLSSTRQVVHACWPTLGKE